MQQPLLIVCCNNKVCDMSYSHLQTAKALHDEIAKRAAAIDGKAYLFFDEIQEVKDWEKCINSFRAILNCDIYITGSNAKLLSGELATYLDGRYVELLERVISYVMTNVGTTFSATSLAKFLKSEQRTVAPETILNYIKYCCDAYLFYQVKREDLQGKQILASNEKYYIADHGIREAVFGGNTKDINLILENVVYLELLRRGYDVTVGRTGDKEIDFVYELSLIAKQLGIKADIFSDGFLVNYINGLILSSEILDARKSYGEHKRYIKETMINYIVDVEKKKKLSLYMLFRK